MYQNKNEFLVRESLLSVNQEHYLSKIGCIVNRRADALHAAITPTRGSLQVGFQKDQEGLWVTTPNSNVFKIFKESVWCPVPPPVTGLLLKSLVRALRTEIDGQRIAQAEQQGTKPLLITTEELRRLLHTDMDSLISCMADQPIHPAAVQQIISNIGFISGYDYNLNNVKVKIKVLA